MTRPLRSRTPARERRVPTLRVSPWLARDRQRAVNRSRKDADAPDAERVARPDAVSCGPPATFNEAARARQVAGPQTPER